MAKKFKEKIMKRYIILVLTILITVTLLVGCSSSSKPADTPAPSDQPKEQEKLSMEESIDGVDKDKAPTSQEEETIDSNKDNSLFEEHILIATYSGNGYDLLVEEDKSQEVTKGVPINYLYIQYNGGIKTLLAQSVDRGNDWTNSVADILTPTLSNDGKKVYYETGSTFTRTSGYGGNNHRTRIIDIDTFNDSYFEEGGIKMLLDNNYGPYKDHLILEINSRDNAGQPTMVYPVVTPEGEQVVILDEFDPNMEFMDIIDSKLQEQSNPPADEASSTAASAYLKILEVPSNGVDKSSFKETYHGELIEHYRYAAVVVEDYPYDGNYPFRYAMQYTNPSYPDGSNSYRIAVMGEVYNVTIKSKAQMDSPDKEYMIADKIEDALIEVVSSFPTDFSVDIITFQDFEGKTYEIPVEDMSDDKSVIVI